MTCHQDHEEVIYFASYVVVDPGPTGLEGKLYYLKLNSEIIMINTQVNWFQKMGAEGIKDLLEEIDLDEELKLLRDELESATGQRLAAFPMQRLKYKSYHN
ncbi:hypothetical protein ACVNP1_15520 [Staphylococcus aureus]